MRSYWPLILSLAVMWAASYLFIEVAVDDIPPAVMLIVVGAILASGQRSFGVGAQGTTA